MKQLKFCTTLLLFISAKEYQDAGEKKYAITSLLAALFLFMFLMVVLFF